MHFQLLNRLLLFATGVCMSPLVLAVVDNMPLFDDGSGREIHPQPVMTLCLFALQVFVGLTAGRIEKTENNDCRWRGLCSFVPTCMTGIAIGMIFFSWPLQTGLHDVFLTKLASETIGFSIFAGGGYLYGSSARMQSLV